MKYVQRGKKEAEETKKKEEGKSSVPVSQFLVSRDRSLNICSVAFSEMDCADAGMDRYFRELHQEGTCGGEADTHRCCGGNKKKEADG